MQDILNRQAKVNKDGSIGILSGFLKCKCCGGNMIKRTSKERVYYYCSNYYRNKTCENNKSVSENGLIEIINEKLNLTNITRLELENKVKCIYIDKDKNVEIVPKTVSAKITITSPSKEVPIKIVPSGKVAFGKAIKSIDSSISSVVVYGDADAVNKIQQLEVEIDVKDLKNDKEYNVTLKKTSGITDLSVNTVKINVTIDNSITKEFNNISVSAENLASGLKAQAMSLEDSKITVVVEGSEDVINNLDPTTIKAYVDLKNTGVGEHEVEVNVTGSDLKLTCKPKTKKVKIKITQE